MIHVTSLITLVLRGVLWPCLKREKNEASMWSERAEIWVQTSLGGSCTHQVDGHTQGHWCRGLGRASSLALCTQLLAPISQREGGVEGTVDTAGPCSAQCAWGALAALCRLGGPYPTLAWEQARQQHAFAWCLSVLRTLAIR